MENFEILFNLEDELKKLQLEGVNVENAKELLNSYFDKVQLVKIERENLVTIVPVI